MNGDCPFSFIQMFSFHCLLCMCINISLYIYFNYLLSMWIDDPEILQHTQLCVLSSG